jgi:predicted amidophosphoribosyltransferase
MFRTCRECNQEYQSWVSVCPDCGVSLDASGPEPLAAQSAPLPPVEDLALLRLDDPWQLQGIAELLQANGISSRIDAHTGGTARLGIYVRRADFDAAHAIAEDLVASSLPDLDSTALSHDPSACPACGEPTPESAASCSACGLEFPEVDTEPGAR